MESVQLGMGREVLGSVRTILTEAAPSESELRGMVVHLCMALSDVLRVADSRGALMNLSVSGSQAASANELDR